MRRLVVLATAIVMAAMVAIPASAAPPGATPVVEGPIFIECGDGVVIRSDVEGWVSQPTMLPGERNVQVRNYHITSKLTNTVTGQKWVIQDTGHIHHFYDSDGEYRWSTSGHFGILA